MFLVNQKKEEMMSVSKGIGGALPIDQGVKVMQQQIANLEDRMAEIHESLTAVAQLSQTLAKVLSTGGKRLPTLDKRPTGPGAIKLVLRWRTAEGV